ncbi:hypothetical protein [Helicobacter turcicus]|uniref:Uncharacterized protein n=1 Tax=Helicobacter turcicus TaxID=2867412 RepID=A0ABS7JKI9_9HELI|nr:hypothetical protein [Helicobacter turcicus]MBX7489908.1 hypothetical protein [Helicobacter turcicus]MBX7544768.1 hypothetical protein [Helicobacter turcicus]
MQILNSNNALNNLSNFKPKIAVAQSAIDNNAEYLNKRGSDFINAKTAFHAFTHKPHFFTYNDFIGNIQFNVLGESKTFKTAIGDAEIFFDYFGDSALEEGSVGVQQINKMGHLFSLDSNGDGFLNRNDEMFSKLRIKVDRGSGEYETANLSDVVGTIDLYSFIKGYDKNNASQIKEWRNSFFNQRQIMVDGRKLTNTFYPYEDIRMHRDYEMKLFSPEQHYKRIKQEDIRAMFEAYADSGGWINLKDRAVNEALFASGDIITNFAYKKTNLAGVEVLEEFNIVDRLDDGSRTPKYEGMNIREFEENWYKHHPRQTNYEDTYTQTFNKLYDTYYTYKEKFAKEKESLLDDNMVSKEYKDKISQIDNSIGMRNIEREFKKLTGIDFSEERLESVKNALNDPLKQKETIAAMGDLDAVTSMRLEKDGRITLRFDSGREILVDGLYNDTGDLHITKKGERASINLEAQTMDNEELNAIDFSQYGISDGENIVSLQEIGAKMIEKLTNSNGKFAGFLITTGNGEIVADNLFNIYTISLLNKDRTLEVEA